MIDRVIEFSVRNRFLVILATAGVTFWGLYCVFRTPVDAKPDLSENQVIVWADWPGRSPREVEDQITYPLSVNLQGLAGIKVIRATSEFGFSMLNLIFDEKIDFYFARQRVLERLSIATGFLPPGVVPFLAPDATALGQIFWYTVEGEGRSLDELRAIQDWYVRYQLNSVPGVAEVASVGGFVREYQVDVDPEKLRAFDISLGQVFSAIMGSNSSVGGKVIQKGGAEYLIRGSGWIRNLDDIRQIVVADRNGVPITVDRLGTVQLGPETRRGMLEKNGEAVGGLVLMRYGENPLAVTERIKEKIARLQAGLPEGVRIVPFYDRTGLIHAAIDTLTDTLIEEILIASLVVFLVLWHLRSSVVIAITLPLAVLISFIFMYYLEIPSNIMSLSGIAISIGVLVDAGIVMTENAYHRLHDRFGDRKVTGDTREEVARACKVVGGPLFFSILIMLLSFAPIFVLSGMEGKMFHPLAYTKSFALVGVAVLAITLVPALIPTFVRGRLRSQEEVWLVRSFVEVYRPMLEFFLRHPDVIVVITGALLLFGLPLFPPKRPWDLFVAGVPFLVATSALLLARRKIVCFSLLALAWAGGEALFEPLGEEFMPPLNEMAIMDMPLTTPNVNITQASQDVIARDSILRQYPEVHQVVGKVGRAGTPTDPAPVDMVETVVTFRPESWWPKRKIRFEEILEEAGKVRAALETRGILRGRADRRGELEKAVQDARKGLQAMLDSGALPAEEISADEALSDAMETWKALRREGRIADVPGMTLALSRAGAVFGETKARRARGRMARPAAYRSAIETLSGDLSAPILAVLDEEDRSLANDAAMAASAGFDRTMRDLAMQRFREYVPQKGRELVRALREEVLSLLRDKGALRKEPSAAAGIEERLAGRYSARFHEWVLLEDVTRAAEEIVEALGRERAVESQADLLLDSEGPAILEVWKSGSGELLRWLQRKGALRRELSGAEWEDVQARWKPVERPTLAQAVAQTRSLIDLLAPLGVLQTRSDLLVDPETWVSKLSEPWRALTGKERQGFPSRLRSKLEAKQEELMAARVRDLNHEIAQRAPETLVWLLVEAGVAKGREKNLLAKDPSQEESRSLVRERVSALGRGWFLWKKDLLDLQNDMHSELQVPGWGNIWTKPIQNREDMLATGVRTMVGVKVFGPRLEDVGGQKGIQTIANEIAEVLKRIRGAADVLAEPVVGENYVEIEIDRGRALKYGVSVEEIQNTIEVALGGKRITTTVEGRERFPVRVRYPRDWRADEEWVKNILVRAGPGEGMADGVAERPAVRLRQVPLSLVADVRIAPGPSMIKSENGLLRIYVQCNVRGRDVVGFVDEARRAVEEKVQLPPGFFVEWTGQFEHQVRAQRTLTIVLPMVIGLIFLILYLTYGDLSDTFMMFLAVPGAVAGGVLFQSLYGHNFSVAVWVGYIACFGLATETGIVMMAYLREAIERRGGMEAISSEQQIREAVIEGAVHRLRPKLLTEGTTILALIPMLWATGVGAEFTRPMAAPILGGILVADEVIDIFIPVLFYWDRCRRLKQRLAGEPKAEN